MTVVALKIVVELVDSFGCVVVVVKIGVDVDVEFDFVVVVVDVGVVVQFVVGVDVGLIVVVVLHWLVFASLTVEGAQGQQWWWEVGHC